jgi:hypothetical protein
VSDGEVAHVTSHLEDLKESVLLIHMPRPEDSVLPCLVDLHFVHNGEGEDLPLTIGFKDSA